MGKPQSTGFQDTEILSFQSRVSPCPILIYTRYTVYTVLPFTGIYYTGSSRSTVCTVHTYGHKEPYYSGRVLYSGGVGGAYVENAPPAAGGVHSRAFRLPGQRPAGSGRVPHVCRVLGATVGGSCVVRRTDDVPIVRTPCTNPFAPPPVFSPTGVQPSRVGRLGDVTCVCECRKVDTPLAFSSSFLSRTT